MAAAPKKAAQNQELLDAAPVATAMEALPVVDNATASTDKAAAPARMSQLRAARQLWSAKADMKEAKAAFERGDKAAAEVASAKAIKKVKAVTEAQGNNKSWIVAVLLAFFLGGLGIHRFYLGYTTEGIIQLLTGGGCGVWALIDFIRILIKDLKPKGGNYE